MTCCRGVSRILSHIYEEPFRKNSERLEADKYLSKKVQR